MFNSVLEVLQIQHLDFLKACMTLKGINAAVVYQ